jgi:iron complex outermembrane receptor protein
MPAQHAFALSLFALASHAAFAQDMPIGEAVQRAPGTKLERVEITQRPQSDIDLRRKAPIAKQIYGREEMDKFGDTNVADVLKRLPGVSVSGGAPKMRGLGSGYTLILINGDPAPPGFALDQLDPAQVERIEVTKGPSADQSAQAVAGAINIILKDAPRVSQRDLRLGMGYNTVRPTPSATFTFGERVGGFSLSLPVSAFEWRNVNNTVTDRTAPGTDYQPSELIQRGEQANWGHGFNSAPRINWKISDEQSASLQSFVQKGFWNNRANYQNQVVSGMPSVDDNSLNHGTWQMLRSNLQWQNRFSDTQRIELKAGVQDAKGTLDLSTFRGLAVQRRSIGSNHEQGLSQAGKYAQAVGDDHSLTFGWDLEFRKRDETRTTTEAGVPQLPEFDGQPFAARITRQALFVQDEWEISPQWSTYLGLRGERIQTQSRGVGNDVDNTSSVVTPLWHLNYKLDPKGKDMIRASLTRSYKAPDLNALMARPALSGLFPDFNAPNTQLSPDRAGNPLLKPELATGLDIAFEKYLSGGGLISIGGFHRSVTNLIRNVTSLQTVSYATVPRFVSQPVNFSKAKTTGLEFELKGRAGELLPSMFDVKTALNLRGSLSVYRSQVEALPGPNNRLDGQQPWSANAGFDYRFTGVPLNTGVSLAYTPGYLTTQTLSQSLDQSRSRSLDVFAQWVISRSASVRVSASNLAPLDQQSRTVVDGGYGSTTERMGRTQFGIGLELKL